MVPLDYPDYLASERHLVMCVCVPAALRNISSKIFMTLASMVHRGDASGPGLESVGPG